MRVDKLFFALNALIILLISILLAGCIEPAQQENPANTAWDVCGNSLCSDGEITTCPQDCKPQEDLATLDDEETLDWLEQMKQERLNNPGKYEPVTPDPETPNINPAALPVETVLPEIGFSVASRNNLLSIDENVSSVAGHFSSAQMRETLRGGTLSSNTEAFGIRSARYEQFLTLRSGKVGFGYDDENEVISSYLEYTEEAPVIEYYFKLHGGIFKFFEGKTINFLGHEYVIEHVTNSTILLLGIDGENEIMLRDGHSSFVNNQQFSPHIHNTTLTQDSFKVIVSIEEDAKLLPGQSLTQYISRRALMTNRIDVTYEGLTEVPSINMHLRKSGQNYRFSFQNNLGINYTLPLTTISPFSIGNEEGRFIYTEGRGNSDYNIHEDDYFIINNGREAGGITTLLRLTEVDYEDKLLTFDDPALEKFHVYFEGNASQGNANADLLVYGVNHKVYIGPNRSVAIDLNGDRTINSAKIAAVAAGNTIIRFDNTSSNLTLKYTIPANLRENKRTDLETLIVLDTNGIRILPSSLELSRDRALDQLVGMNDYGTLFVLKRNINTREQRGTELIINQPLVQRFAEVIVKAYK
jgi:hypothetical protein